MSKERKTVTDEELVQILRREMGRRAVTDGWLMRIDARLAKIVPPGRVLIASGSVFMDTETGSLIGADEALVMADRQDLYLLPEGAKPPAKQRKHRRIEL